MEQFDRQDLDDQIQVALGTHGALKHKLRAAVEHGHLPHPSHAIATDCACRFGEWLHHLKGDQDIARSPHFRAVVTAHAGFHKAAGRVARMVEDGRRDRAAEMLNELGYRRASDILMSEMKAWRRSI